VGSQQEEDVLLKGKMKRKKTVPKVFLWNFNFFLNF
jgi:hypothetical protein